MKITKSQLRKLIKEAQWGNFTGGAAPLDEPMRDSGPIPKDQLRKLADLYVWDLGMKPDEVLQQPEFIEAGITDLAQLEEGKMRITKLKLADLVRSVDYEGDEWGGDFEKVVGDQIGTVVEIDDDQDGTQYTVLFPDGTTIMDSLGPPDEPRFELVNESKMKITKKQLRRIIKEQHVELLKEERYDCIKDYMAMGYSKSDAYKECPPDGEADDDWDPLDSRRSHYPSKYGKSYSSKETRYVGKDANASKISAVEASLDKKADKFLNSVLSQLKGGLGLSPKQNSIVKKIIAKTNPEFVALFESSTRDAKTKVSSRPRRNNAQHEGTPLDDMPDSWRQILGTCLKDR